MMENEITNTDKSSLEPRKPLLLMPNVWVSVNERLPEHENNVLAVLDGQVCIMSYFSFQENGETNKVWGYVYDGINGDGIFDDNYYPTHWMDIPCLPSCK